MKFINLSNNTIYLSDIKKDIPFNENEELSIGLDDIKKSTHFRKMIIAGIFKITEIDNSILERNLLRIQKEQNNMKNDNIYINQEIEKEETKSTEIEVKLRGHFYEAGGYSKVNRNLAIGLNNLGIKVQIDSINNRVNNLSEEELQKLSQASSQVSRNAIVIDSVIPTFGNICSGKYKILYTTIEAYSVPKQFIEMTNSYNEIWVVSDFCKEILLKYECKRPIFVLPDSIDTELYKNNVEPYNFKPNLKKFVFLFVGSWTYRKGYDVLLKSYLKEFNGKEDVSLLVMSRPMMGIGGDNTIKNEIQRFIDNCGNDNPPHIARCSKVIPENMMPNIYKSCNALVSFSRGEAFSLTPCEASLCGLPVIGTKCSGQTMFLNDDNSYLLNIDKISPLQQGLSAIHYWDNHLFPEYKSDNSIIEAGKLMRHVYENYQEAIKKNKKLSSFIKKNYNIENVSSMAKNRLEEIWETIK